MEREYCERCGYELDMDGFCGDSSCGTTQPEVPSLEELSTMPFPMFSNEDAVRRFFNVQTVVS